MTLYKPQTTGNQILSWSCHVMYKKIQGLKQEMLPSQQGHHIRPSSELVQLQPCNQNIYNWRILLKVV